MVLGRLRAATSFARKKVLKNLLVVAKLEIHISPNSVYTVGVLAVFKSPTKCEPPTATPRPRSKLLVFTVLGDTLVRPSAAVWSIMASCMHFYNIKLIFLGLEAS